MCTVNRTVWVENIDSQAKLIEHINIKTKRNCRHNKASGYTGNNVRELVLV